MCYLVASISLSFHGCLCRCCFLSWRKNLWQDPIPFPDEHALSLPLLSWKLSRGKLVLKLVIPDDSFAKSATSWKEKYFSQYNQYQSNNEQILESKASAQWLALVLPGIWSISLKTNLLLKVIVLMIDFAIVYIITLEPVSLFFTPQVSILDIKCHRWSRKGVTWKGEHNWKRVLEYVIRIIIGKNNLPLVPAIKKSVDIFCRITLVP